MSALHPAVKKIKSKRIAIAIGLIILLINIVTFATFLGTSYASRLKSKFLSLEKDAGLCQSITLSTTDMLLLDKNGNWESSSAFQIQEALFGVSFNAYRADGSSWKKDMGMLNTAIQTEMDFLRTSSDLATKILHLFSWRKTITATKAGTIKIWFNAAPSYTFNTPGTQLDSLFGEYATNCKNNDGWGINADGVLTTTFNDVWNGLRDDNDEAIVQWACSGFQITDVGFDVKYSTEAFNFDIDLRTAATVASLNAEIISAGDLLTVTDKFYPFQNDDAPSTAPDSKVMFDPKFPNSKAVYYDTATDAYAVRFGDTGWNVKFSGSYHNWVLDMTTSPPTHGLPQATRALTRAQ